MTTYADLAAARAAFLTDAALFHDWLHGPASGGTSIVDFGGGLTIKTLARLKAEAEALGAIGTPAITANVLTLDLSAYGNFLVALNANITTVTISNWPAGVAASLTLQLTGNGTGYTYAGLTAACTWLNGSPAPSTTNAKKNLYNIFSLDQGTTKFGMILGENL